MSSETRTAATVRASVSMLSRHSPWRPKSTNPATARAATRTFPNTHETYPTRATTPSQPTTGTGRPYDGCATSAWRKVTRLSITSRISLKT